MSQKSSAPATRAGAAATKAPAEQVVRDIRRATRKQHSAEDKIRIVLEGLRGEESIAALCRREGIAESLYYSWSKEFLGSAHCAERQASLDGRHGPRRPATRLRRCARKPVRSRNKKKSVSMRRHRGALLSAAPPDAGALVP
jgi:transposase-like protein